MRVKLETLRSAEETRVETSQMHGEWDIYGSRLVR